LSSAPATLISRLQRLIECSYDWRTGIADLTPFLIGDRGYRALYEGREILEEVPGPDVGPRTLVTCREGAVRLGIYYPDSLVRRLEAAPPLRGINEHNLVPFVHLVEELDHFLMLAWCIPRCRVVRLVELEFHANVTKYLVLAHFLGRLREQNRLLQSERDWLVHCLFEDAGADLPEPFRRRYRTAAQMGVLFIRELDALPPWRRVCMLRRFGRRSWGELRQSLESSRRREALGLLLAS
jgi:hypothetical protein